MDEIEEMEQQPIATESVFANVEPMTEPTSAVEAAAAAVVSLSNNAGQQQTAKREIVGEELGQQELVQQALQEAEVIQDNTATVTAVHVTAPAEFDPSSTSLPISTPQLQINSSLPISGNLEVTSALTSTPIAAITQIHPASTSMVAVTDVTSTPVKVDHDVQPHSQSYEEVKDWLITQHVPEQEAVVPAPTQKLSRRRYSVDFKLLAVDYTKTHSKNETARHFKVHKKQIQEWCKHKDDLIAMKNIVDSGGKVTRGHGRKSLFRSNAGLRPYSIAIDNAVRDYFVDCSKAGLKVTKRMLQEKAYELHQSRTDGNANFTGSDGWLTKFVQRHGINLKDGTIENPGEMFTSDPEASQTPVGSAGNDIVSAATAGLEMTADPSTGYDDNASLDIVKVDTEEASATSTEHIMETVEQGAEISTSVLEESSSATSTPLRPKRKQYSIDEKEYIANHARIEGVSQTVFKFGIPEETIRHWMKIDFDQYKEWKSQVKKKGAPKRKNAPGAGRPLKYPREVDCELRDWIVQQQAENNPVSEQALREKAQEMIEPHCPSFKHSSSWLKSFMQRHKLNESTVEGTEVYMAEAGQDMYIDTIDDTYVATDVQSVASQYVTASGVTLLIRQNTEQGDTYDEIALKEYSMDALKAVISVRLGIPEDSIAGLLKEKHRKDGNAVWVRVSTDEDVMRLQDDDLITIVTNNSNNP